jgi:hypothetical protein
MLLLHVSAATASHRHGEQVVITYTTLSVISLYLHLVVASLTLCSLQTMMSFTVCVAPSDVGLDTDTVFTRDVTHYNVTIIVLIEF